jgi:hypothetical protein
MVVYRTLVCESSIVCIVLVWRQLGGVWPLSSGWLELGSVLTRFVISYHYSVVEVRRVGLNFVIHSGSVWTFCEHDISV